MDFQTRFLVFKVQHKIQLFVKQAANLQEYYT